jgi:hypothetical protein
MSTLADSDVLVWLARGHIGAELARLLQVIDAFFERGQLKRKAESRA